MAPARPGSPDDSPPRLPAPGMLRRLAAMFYESLLLLAVLSVVFLLPQAAIATLRNAVAPTALLVIHFVAVTAFYFVWFWHGGGQTLAMKTWRIRLEGAGDGRPISAGKALVRFCLAWPSVLTGIGLLWALVDRDGQFLHDRLARTRLVLTPLFPPEHRGGRGEEQ